MTKAKDKTVPLSAFGIPYGVHENATVFVAKRKPFSHRSCIFIRLANGDVCSSSSLPAKLVHMNESERRQFAAALNVPYARVREAVIEIKRKHDEEQQQEKLDDLHDLAAKLGYNLVKVNK